MFVILREGNDAGLKKKVTYQELLKQICKFSNVLKDFGIRKGDRVAIYMPVTIECVIAMLSCARIGAVHSVVVRSLSLSLSLSLLFSYYFHYDHVNIMFILCFFLLLNK